jgi:hypothetical protein
LRYDRRKILLSGLIVPPLEGPYFVETSKGKPGLVRGAKWFFVNPEGC